MNPSGEQHVVLKVTPAKDEIIWRVEDSLLDLGAVRPLAFFARNAYRYSERWKRLATLYGVSVARVLLYSTSPVLSSRVLHLCLAGMSRDRLEILGEEYFEIYLRQRLKKSGVEPLQRTIAREGSVVLISQGLEHIVRPLARHLGVDRFIANRLEWRDGAATGRLLEPIVHSRGGIANLASRDSHGQVSTDELSANLGVDKETLRRAVLHVQPPSAPPRRRPVVFFPGKQRVHDLSVRTTLAGKQVLLIGGTGFIGKVWLAHVLTHLPEIGKIHLLIRRQQAASAQRRFETMMEESPVFAGLHERHGNGLAQFIRSRVEIVEGDVTKPDLGIAAHTLDALRRQIDVVVNSAGLTDFNPDLRNALAANVDATQHLLEFIRTSQHAALLHLSTCFVVGEQEGRITEQLQPNYSPRAQAGFDAQREHAELRQRIEDARQWPPNPKLVAELETPLEGTASNGSRFGWLRRVLTEVGRHRARELGWPNAYTFTKSLGESLLVRGGRGLPIAIVRPAIVETSLDQPFAGWNEGINTSAPLSWLLGTTFRQLPANERKCLDVVPVDLVCKGMTLVAAALVRRCHEPLYQMASSVSNPLGMTRVIELTSLAHRKHYIEQRSYLSWWKARMDAIPVSKRRYQTLSAPRHKAVLGSLRRLLSATPLGSHLARAERAVGRIAKLVEIYEPFILYNEHVFEAENIRVLSAALPAEERAAFACEMSEFDWHRYWVDVHIPAMRRWCYPLIEGRTLETSTRFRFRLPEPVPPEVPRGVETIGTQA